MRSSPVIILGMHRSGTTMVTDLLERIGLFVGQTKEVNNESVFFNMLNTWAMQEAYATWDNPRNMLFLNDYYLSSVRRVLEGHLRTIKAAAFLGWKRYWAYRDIRNLDTPWGWKDPRNTFTIDLWHDIFPRAKVIHIFRNPIDVAQSLSVREKRKNDAIAKGGIRLKGWRLRKREYRLKRRVGYQEAFALADIRENIALWELYTRKALSLDTMLGGNLLHVRYESLLEDFSSSFAAILDFVGLRVGDDIVRRMQDEVRTDRMFAFTRKPDMVKLYNEIKQTDLMRRLDYHSIA